MNFISERRSSLSHITQDVIACHLLDGCLLTFLISLIPIQLTPKKSSQWKLPLWRWFPSLRDNVILWKLDYSVSEG